MYPMNILRRCLQVIVDTSNEIGGDGDVPHPAIGGARRMQVPDPSQQHRVMVRISIPAVPASQSISDFPLPCCNSCAPVKGFAKALL